MPTFILSSNDATIVLAASNLLRQNADRIAHLAHAAERDPDYPGDSSAYDLTRVVVAFEHAADAAWKALVEAEVYGECPQSGAVVLGSQTVVA